jgi:hypothetical protein
MPNLKSPGKKMGKPQAAPVAPVIPSAPQAARRLSRVAANTAQACAQFCMVVERMKGRGIAVADIETELGLDAGDLKATFDMYKTAAETTSDVVVADWT